MSARRQEDAWALLEIVGAYAAGELQGEEAREAEQLIFERPEYRRLAESYALARSLAHSLYPRFLLPWSVWI